ncbi:pyridoxamine 5'-phosphate oxidase family protein [Staphylococcus massiliensis]|uniref:General stress protein FMN-binding split barrel domain-containing protein n=1 Tax=Staphylococcus massiliensis S46 TaxID=1229783 RepID=K9AS48_9STAP|nr:pyridoxamine 5'-phosphate oxidase family protein [Staphylococcus massiliensis]EKU50154.1 hypothetical protein C273_02768 [Staphylococcus massiliensis S46]MCG3399621.1 pyridoxamine 5'-phosphate oxidase family protein [Staphylococcus massiliensis]MCG3402132.1 pyridoxamine 5'-phosphate oxidase family protein [Staphylococcus massiliensis]MCG3413298.1 pyridoxamine 5'-phosphate oxidase family protein [Staphylococcus massiliensis]POA00849.1 pyridoxamine 5-phosphate oxidase [Staphylococcus massilie
MNKEQVEKRMQEILEASKVGVMSTSYNDVPNSRYMVFYHDGLTLYTKTSDKTMKIEEIEHNPVTHVLLGYNETDNNSFLEIYADIEIKKDQETIDKLWETQDKSFFDSSKDPDLVVLKLTPKKAKIMNDDEVDSPVEIDL